MRGQPRDALNLRSAVGFRVHCEAAAVVLGALTKVDAAGEFADDIEIYAAGDGFFERGGGEEGGRGEEAGAQVAEGLELFAEAEDALFGADGTGAPFLWRSRERISECGGIEVVQVKGRRTGPPMAPRMIASASLAALRAESVNGSPVASIEH